MQENASVPARRPSRGFIAAITLAVLVAASAWAYTAPKRTLAAIRDAAEAGDSERLAELVDFPAVRESLKEQLRASMAAEVAKSSKENADDPFAAAGAAFGMMLASSLVDTFVDTAVSPTGMARLASGKRPEMPGNESSSTEPAEEAEPEMGYETPSRYVVRFSEPEKPDEGVSLILRRNGLSWRLSTVRFEGLAG